MASPSEDTLPVDLSQAPPMVPFETTYCVEHFVDFAKFHYYANSTRAAEIRAMTKKDETPEPSFSAPASQKEEEEEAPTSQVEEVEEADNNVEELPTPGRRNPSRLAKSNHLVIRTPSGLGSSSSPTSAASSSSRYHPYASTSRQTESPAPAPKPKPSPPMVAKPSGPSGYLSWPDLEVFLRQEINGVVERNRQRNCDFGSKPWICPCCPAATQEASSPDEEVVSDEEMASDEEMSSDKETSSDVHIQTASEEEDVGSGEHAGSGDETGFDQKSDSEVHMSSDGESPQESGKRRDKGKGKATAPASPRMPPHNDQPVRDWSEIEFDVTRWFPWYGAVFTVDSCHEPMVMMLSRT